jgi:hypothetical protein
MTYRIRRRIWAIVIGTLVAANLWLGAGPSAAGTDVHLEGQVATVAEGVVAP